MTAVLDPSIPLPLHVYHTTPTIVIDNRIPLSINCDIASRSPPAYSSQLVFLAAVRYSTASSAPRLPILSHYRARPQLPTTQFHLGASLELRRWYIPHCLTSSPGIAPFARDNALVPAKSISSSRSVLHPVHPTEYKRMVYREEYYGRYPRCG